MHGNGKIPNWLITIVYRVQLGFLVQTVETVGKAMLNAEMHSLISLQIDIV